MLQPFRRHFLLAATLCLGGCGWTASTLNAQGTSGCLPADTVRVPAHLDYLKRVVTDTDSVSRAVRDSLGLQATTAGKVSLVTKASTCTSAVAALNAVAGTSGAVRHVWVYALGSNFAVEDPTISSETAGGLPFYLFDSKWKPKPILIY
jgi:hypothetical protein